MHEDTRAYACGHTRVVVRRYFNKQKNYSPFYDFKWADYEQRLRVVRTFEERFMDLPSCLPDEPEWVTGNEETVEEAAVSMPASATRAASEKTSGMVWDDELNIFVKVCPHA